MTPPPNQRDDLFKAFARALFKRDMDALYRAVTPDFWWSYSDGSSAAKLLDSAPKITAHLDEQAALFSEQRFLDVAYHHLPELSFMTCRVTETYRASGVQREQRVIEQYTFADGKIACKDVYRKSV
jgi:hypothetical protein